MYERQPSRWSSEGHSEKHSRGPRVCRQCGDMGSTGSDELDVRGRTGRYRRVRVGEAEALVGGSCAAILSGTIASTSRVFVASDCGNAVDSRWWAQCDVNWSC